MTVSEKVVFVKTFFFFDFDEDDIITNLADTAPGNDVFAFSAGKKTEFAGTWNDESSDGSCFAVELQIDRAAKTATGTGIDDFFLSKLT